MSMKREEKRGEEERREKKRRGAERRGEERRGEESRSIRTSLGIDCCLCQYHIYKVASSPATH
jgi:hypothetical protein